jgi:hypothetical protein
MALPEPVAPRSVIRKPAPPRGSLSVPIIVKEAAGVGAQDYPVTAVVPLARYAYADTASFRLTNEQGAPVPAQFEVLNRWWADDNSVRHLAVHFQPTVAAFTTPGSGTATYFLRDDGTGNTTPAHPVTVKDGATEILIMTGPLKILVSKRDFRIINEAWLDVNGDGQFTPDERILKQAAQGGGVLTDRNGNPQLDAARADVKFAIEEAGPLRAVIRAEAVTKYQSTADHTHGWAVRIYAFAGKPYVKVDYQLQNSAKTKKYAWPLYFKDLRLNFDLKLSGPPQTRFSLGRDKAFAPAGGGAAVVVQERHDVTKVYGNNNAVLAGTTTMDGRHDGSLGWADVRDERAGVAAFVRNFWQTWPNALAVTPDHTLSVRLFPEGGQMLWVDAKENCRTADTYWLDDMQHMVKESLLYFHGAAVPNESLHALCRTFNTPPVPMVPPGWYQQTRATVDMGGLIPLKTWLRGPDRRRPEYPTAAYKYGTFNYNFHWTNYLGDVYRRRANATGGVPLSGVTSVATGNPADYFEAEARATGDLNCRPQWLAQYQHARDYPLLRLRDVYSSNSWRAHEPGKPRLDAPYLPGTGPTGWTPRDDAHAWYYHLEEFYYLSGNPWIRDWYEFLGQFRRARFLQLENVDHASRAYGHSLASALQAYRVTGDKEILRLFREHAQKFMRPEQHPQYGHNIHSDGASGEEAAFCIGFLARAFESYLDEVRDADPQAWSESFNLLSGYLEWNLNFGSFCYWLNVTKGTVGKSSGTATPLVDPVVWYYWQTGKRPFIDHLNQYVSKGIPAGGAQPYNSEQLTEWKGTWLGRYYRYLKDTPRADKQPLAAINDLKVTLSGGRATASWRTPPGAKRFHVVWGAKPLVEKTTTDAGKLNWWAANAVGPALVARPNERQSVSFRFDGPEVYVGVFTFDAADNMSSLSNVARIGVNKQ